MLAGKSQGGPWDQGERELDVHEDLTCGGLDPEKY